MIPAAAIVAEAVCMAVCPTGQGELEVPGDRRPVRLPDLDMRVPALCGQVGHLDVSFARLLQMPAVLLHDGPVPHKGQQVLRLVAAVKHQALRFPLVQEHQQEVHVDLCEVGVLVPVIRQRVHVQQVQLPKVFGVDRVLPRPLHERVVVEHLGLLPAALVELDRHVEVVHLRAVVGRPLVQQERRPPVRHKQRDLDHQPHRVLALPRQRVVDQPGAHLLLDRLQLLGQLLKPRPPLRRRPLLAVRGAVVLVVQRPRHGQVGVGRVELQHVAVHGGERLVDDGPLERRRAHLADDRRLLLEQRGRARLVRVVVVDLLLDQRLALSVLPDHGRVALLELELERDAAVDGLELGLRMDEDPALDQPRPHDPDRDLVQLLLLRVDHNPGGCVQAVGGQQLKRQGNNDNNINTEALF